MHNIDRDSFTVFSPATTVTLNNASNYQANGLLSDYIGWTNGLSD